MLISSFIVILATNITEKPTAKNIWSNRNTMEYNINNFRFPSSRHIENHCKGQRKSDLIKFYLTHVIKLLAKLIQCLGFKNKIKLKKRKNQS